MDYHIISKNYDVISWVISYDIDYENDYDILLKICDIIESVISYDMQDVEYHIWYHILLLWCHRVSHALRLTVGLPAYVMSSTPHPLKFYKRQKTRRSRLYMTSKTQRWLLSTLDQLVGPVVVFWCFAQFVDLSNDWIHSPVKHIEATLCLPVLVMVGASWHLGNGPNSKHLPSVLVGHDALIVVQTTVQNNWSQTKYTQTIQYHKLTHNSLCMGRIGILCLMYVA